MKNLEEKLDQLVLQILDVLEKLYRTKESLDQVMRDGFFNLSRTRYNLGVNRVSSDQIVEADLKATCTVLVCDSKDMNDENSTDTGNDINKSHPNDAFELCKAVRSLKIKSDDDCYPFSQQSGSDIEMTVRKRNLKDSSLEPQSVTKQDANMEKSKQILKSLKGNEGKENVPSSDFKKENESSSAKVTDPISLFGVLVPQTLRSGQKNFEDAVERVITIANLQHRIMSLQKEYRCLLKEKKERENGC